MPTERFDELARGLADGGLSRRRALRLPGAALARTVMASIPGVAWAKRCRPGEFKVAAPAICCEFIGDSSWDALMSVVGHLSPWLNWQGEPHAAAGRR